MAKKLLFLEDLYEFYINKKEDIRFSSIENDNSPIVVQTHGNLNFEKNTVSDGLMPVVLQACHTQKNINGSNINDDVMEDALPSFCNRPILGYIHTVNGQPEFYTHNLHLDDDGNVVYDEVPLGIIPESCNAKIVYDEEKQKKYVNIKGYIFEEYSKAAEILKRENECSVSVELAIEELSFNAKENILNIEKFHFNGVTILGKTEDGDEVRPGMVGSNIKIGDFSQDTNSIFENYENKLDSLRERLDEIISHFEKNDKKGGMQMSKFEELLKKYDKTVDDIDFDYESLSDEELEVAFQKAFDGNSNTDDGTNEDDKFTKTFELSHDDIRCALYNLLIPFEESDNACYWISDVYDTYFVYEDWNNHVYGQKYDVDGDNVTLDGERYNLHRELLTDSEFAELQSMRSNYAALVDFKNETDAKELHSQREKVLTDKAYEIISAKDDEGNFINEPFAKLYENMDNYSPEELVKEVKILVGEYALQGGNVKAKVEKKSGVKHFSNPNSNEKKTSKYGTLKFK